MTPGSCYNAVKYLKYIFIYILKFYVPVGWLVGLSGFHAPTGRRIRTVYMSKKNVQATELTWRGLFPDPATSRGHKGGEEAPPQNFNTSQIPLILMKFESYVLDTI